MKTPAGYALKEQKNNMKGGTGEMLYVFNEPEIEVVSLAAYDDVITDVSSGGGGAGGDLGDDMFD